MIRYDQHSDGVRWSVIRKGVVVAQGSSSNMTVATFSAEDAVISSFNTEKIATVVLLGVGENQLSLLKTTK